jgi:hypothetical protein
MKLPLAMLAVTALVSAVTPPELTPISNGKDLSGWQVSQVNHHDNTRGRTVRGGVMLATQDRPAEERRDLRLSEFEPRSMLKVPEH